MARAKDEIHEQRITMEVIVDAYGSSERAMGFHSRRAVGSFGPSPF
jgi:Calcium binding